MVRESLLVALAALVSSPGCSFLLDFSDAAGVHDASIDGPFTLAECSYKEPNDSVDAAVVIDPATDTGPAAICPPTGGAIEDDDYYKFTVAAGTTKVTITLQDGAGGDLDLKLYDASAQVIGQSRNFSTSETLVCPGVSPACPALSAGDYVFEVLPGSPANLNNYTFGVTLE